MFLGTHQLDRAAMLVVGHGVVVRGEQGRECRDAQLFVGIVVFRYCDAFRKDDCDHALWHRDVANQPATTLTHTAVLASTAIINAIAGIVR